MRAREIFFVIFVILFGLSIQSITGHRPWKNFRIDGHRVADEYHEYTESKEEAVDTTVPLRVENSNGDIVIRGWDQPRVSVQLRKRVYIDDEAKARQESDKVHIVFESRNGETLLTSTRKAIDRDGDTMETHFEITVPSSLILKTVNRHGDTTLENLLTAGIEISEGYGDLIAKTITGDMKVIDEHSDIAINDLTGSLILENSYDDVTLVGVSGDVKAKNNHGDVHVEQVGGSLELQADYGDVRIKQIAKDVTAVGDHSAIRAGDCAGNVTLRNSYQEVSADNVSGDVQINGEHSPVSFRKIGGQVKVTTSYKDVEGAAVKGFVEIEGEHSGIELRDVSSGCTIKTSYSDVQVLDFDGKLDLTVNRGSSRLVARSAPSAPITVRTEYGDVRLALPPGSQFQLQAESLSGDVNVSFPMLNSFRTQQNQLVRVTGTSGAAGGKGGASIEIRSSYGDINVTAKGEDND